jgi:ketosteroid isomerase-like protein
VRSVPMMSADSPQAAVDAFVAAMRAKDLEGMLRLVTDDIVLIGSEGHEVARGRDEVRTLLAEVMAAEASYGWDIARAEIREQGDVAWFAADTTLEARSGPHTTRLPYRLTGILLKCPGVAWRWWHFHGSEPARRPG